MKAQRAGFSIVEVIISIVLLGIILTALAGLTYTTARQAMVSADRAHQQALTLELVNRFSALPYDSLTNGYSYVDSAGSANNWVRRSVTVTRTGNTAAVVVATTPAQRNVIPMTIRFTRAAPVTANPLWTP